MFYLAVCDRDKSIPTYYPEQPQLALLFPGG